MSITYKWIIEQIQTYPEMNNYNDVVFNVCWRLNATDGDYSVNSHGYVGIQFDTTKSFTPYSNLTEIEVIEWVKNALGEQEVSDIKNSLAEQINDLITPTTSIAPLPWG